MTEPTGLWELLIKLIEPTALWGFLGTLVGGAVSVFTNILTARQSRLIERNRSTENRQESAREFQRNTLLQIQDEIQLSAATTSALQALLQFGNEDQLNKNLINKKDEHILTTNRIALLMQRVASESLRYELQSFCLELYKIAACKTADEISEATSDHGKNMGKLASLVGIELRKHFEKL